MKMPFGKYKGLEIEYVPTTYLKWVLENVNLNSLRLVNAIHKQLFKLTWEELEVLDYEQQDWDEYERRTW